MVIDCTSNYYLFNQFIIKIELPTNSSRKSSCEPDQGVLKLQE